MYIHRKEIVRDLSTFEWKKNWKKLTIFTLFLHKNSDKKLLTNWKKYIFFNKWLD